MCLIKGMQPRNFMHKQEDAFEQSVFLPLFLPGYLQESTNVSFNERKKWKCFSQCMTKNVFIFTPHYLLLCDISPHAISHRAVQWSPSNIPALGLRSVWQAPLFVGVEILLSQFCSCNDSFWLSSSGGVVWALSFLTVLQFYSGSQMPQGQDRSSLTSKGIGFKLGRWVATAAVPEKRQKHQVSAQPFLDQEKQDATAALRALWLGYFSTSQPSTHLLSAKRGRCGEGWFCSELRQWPGSSVVSREGSDSHVWLRKGCMIQEDQQSHLKDWSFLKH